MSVSITNLSVSSESNMFTDSVMTSAPPVLSATFVFSMRRGGLKDIFVGIARDYKNFYNVF